MWDHIYLNFWQKKINYIGIDNLSYSYKRNVKNKNKHFKIDISDKKKFIKFLKILILI